MEIFECAFIYYSTVTYIFNLRSDQIHVRNWRKTEQALRIMNLSLFLHFSCLLQKIF